MAVLRAPRPRANRCTPAPVTPDPRVTKSAHSLRERILPPAGKAFDNNAHLSLVDGANDPRSTPRMSVLGRQPHYTMYLIAFGRDAKKQVVN